MSNRSKGTYHSEVTANIDDEKLCNKLEHANGPNVPPEWLLQSSMEERFSSLHVSTRKERDDDQSLATSMLT